MGVLEGIGAVTGAVGGLLTGVSANRISRDNLQLQKDTLEYQKGIQQQMFDREDSSVQRRVADLKQAGISPVLAAGQGARAGAPINVTAPQRSETGMQALGKGLSGVLENIGALRDISKTLAETALTNAKEKESTQEYTYREQMNPIELARAGINRDFLKKTLSTRVATENDVNRAREAIAELDEHEAGRLLGYIQMLKSGKPYVPGEYHTGFVRPSRRELEYDTALIMHALNSKQLSWYEAFKGAGPAAQLGNTLLRVLGMILKN